LEKWVSGAGLAIIQVFFPTSFGCDDSRVRYNIAKSFGGVHLEQDPLEEEPSKLDGKQS
jgi:hypothetical protein